MVPQLGAVVKFAHPGKFYNVDFQEFAAQYPDKNDLIAYHFQHIFPPCQLQFVHHLWLVRDLLVAPEWAAFSRRVWSWNWMVWFFLFMGPPVTKVSCATWFRTSALAGLSAVLVAQPYQIKSPNRNRTRARVVRQNREDEQVDLLEGPSSSSLISTMQYSSTTFAQAEADVETHEGVDPEEFDELCDDFVDGTDYSTINWYVECLIPGTCP